MSLLVSPAVSSCRVIFYTATRGPIMLAAQIGGDVGPRDLQACYVERSVNTPAGKWEMHLTGRQIHGESYARIIQPMDYVEIEFSTARSTLIYAGGELISGDAPGSLIMTMRGFVDNCQESVDGQGNYSVVVNGRDYGKLLLQFQVWYRAQFDPYDALLQQIGGLYFNFGMPIGSVAPNDFINAIVLQIIKPNLDRLKARLNNRPPDFFPSVTVDSMYAVDGFAIQAFTGSVWNLIQQYAARPWIETFVSDQFQPILYYRFPPYVEYDGTVIDDGSHSARAPHTSQIDEADIVSYSMGTSDNEMYSYYFTYPVYSSMSRLEFKASGNAAAGSGLDPNPFLDQPQLDVYGFRPLEIACPLIPTGVLDQPALADPNRLPNTVPFSVVQTASRLNNWLYRSNKDNNLFANGEIVCRGSGDIQIGAFLNVTGLNIQGYVASVRHDFSVTQNAYTTTIGLTRVRPM